MGLIRTLQKGRLWWITVNHLCLGFGAFGVLAWGVWGVGVEMLEASILDPIPLQKATTH